jgi:CBS domain containing-hemolysin-like protein
VLGLFLAALFIALNGFFVAAEFALVKLRATRTTRTREPQRGEAMVQHAVDRLDRYLGVTQLGVTLASLGLGWIGEPAVARLGDTLMRRFTGRPLGSTGVAVSFAAAFAVLTVAHVLLGELVPKLVAIQRSKETALATVPFLRALNVVLYPALWLLEKASRAVLVAIRLPFDAYGEAALSEDEILGILAANVARTPRGAHKQELFARVTRFAKRTARSAMVPRVDVAALAIDSKVEDAVEFLRQQQYSRVLLFRGDSMDDVAGYLYVKDLAMTPDGALPKTLDAIRRDVLFVPEAQGLMDTLRNMQRGHTPFAVVVDEYGGTSGIITMEDLLEEIVGEISDETDVESARIDRRADAWEIDGRVTLEELMSLGAEPSEDERGVSLGAFVMAKLERLPRLGDRIEIGTLTAEVLAISRRRVTRVRLRRAASTRP